MTAEQDQSTCGPFLAGWAREAAQVLPQRCRRSPPGLQAGRATLLLSAPLLFAGQHEDAQHRDECVFEHGVVVHDDGHPTNVRQVPAAAGRGRARAAGARAGAELRHSPAIERGRPGKGTWVTVRPDSRCSLHTRPAHHATPTPTLPPAAATHPTTLPMMCPRLSHSWPLGYRLRSSPQLLSPCGVGQGRGKGS